MTGPYVQPSGLEVDFDRNITTLYECITSCNWDEAIKAARSNPKEAKTWVVRHYDEEDSEGEDNEIMWRFLPLHSACARQPPADVVKALLHAYPDGAKCVDDQGMYALHYACGNQASREVIRMLLMSFPEAAKLTDPRGMLPIHYLACWGPSSISVVDMVLVANRDVANARDEDGNTPLDLALEGEYPESSAVVSALKRWLDNASSKGGTSTRTKPIIKVKSDEKKEPEEEPVAPRSPRSMPISPASGGRLRHELAEMKKVKAANESDWKGRIHSQEAEFTRKLADMENRLKELEVETEESNRTIAELEGELQDKDFELHNVKKKAEIKAVELDGANDERDGLRQTLADLTDQHDKYKVRSEMLGDRLGSLSVSLYSMLEQQSVVLEAMNAREEQWAALSDIRRDKMRELVALEEQEAQEEVELKTCLTKQTREMEAISAVIAAARQQGL
jgi:hypothetical protein